MVMLEAESHCHVLVIPWVCQPGDSVGYKEGTRIRFEGPELKIDTIQSGAKSGAEV